jgi:transcriptional regulator with XRE-family HTH domain
MCGLSNAYISMLEKGVNPSTGEPALPSMNAYLQISQAMGVSLQTLMEAVDDTVDISAKKITKAFTNMRLQTHPDVTKILTSRLQTSEELDQDQDRLEALHQNPRLGLLFDRTRKMSHEDIEFMLQFADRITKDREG